MCLSDADQHPGRGVGDAARLSPHMSMRRLSRLAEGEPAFGRTGSRRHHDNSFPGPEKLSWRSRQSQRSTPVPEVDVGCKPNADARRLAPPACRCPGRSRSQSRQPTAAAGGESERHTRAASPLKSYPRWRCRPGPLFRCAFRCRPAPGAGKSPSYSSAWRHGGDRIRGTTLVCPRVHARAVAK